LFHFAKERKSCSIALISAFFDLFWNMNGLENRLSSLEQKLRQFVALWEEQQAAYTDLKEQLDALKRENSQLKEELESVKEHRKHLLFSHSIQGDDNLKFAKKQLSDMIREVDRCMSLIVD
jgi:septation ring formation regulator EzrA